jgi:hypothetical protein
MLLSVAFSALLYFPHYLINGTIFEKVTEHEMCVLISLRRLSQTFFILRRNEQNIIKIYIVLHVSTGYYSSILMNLEFAV